VILILAANASFNGFPRLASVQASDGYLPRQLGSLGDRLVFANGIVLLGAVSAGLIVAFHGDTHRLIPLYAVGVFLSFTLSQAGMVRHWLLRRQEESHWRTRVAINGFGAAVTAVVTVVIAITKFTHGAWIVVVLIPALVWAFVRIHRHYLDFAARISLDDATRPGPVSNLVLVLVASVHRGMLEAVHYAKSLSTSDDDVRAIHIETERPAPRPSLMASWDTFGLGIPLVVLHSPYRSLLGPLVEYIDTVLAQKRFDVVTVVLPEVVTKHWWEQLLHNQTALQLQIALHGKPHVVFANYRYYIGEEGETEQRQAAEEQQGSRG